MRPTTVFSIELTNEDLADLPAIDKPSGRGRDVVSLTTAAKAMAAANDYDLVEIELTAEEMDDLLSER